MERDSIQGEAFDNFPGYIDKEGVKKRIEQSGLTFSEDGGNASDDSSDSSSDSSSSDESVDEVIDKPLQHEQETYQWKTGCDIYQHRKTKVLHLKPQLDQKDIFSVDDP